MNGQLNKCHTILKWGTRQSKYLFGSSSHIKNLYHKPHVATINNCTVHKLVSCLEGMCYQLQMTLHYRRHDDEVCNILIYRLQDNDDLILLHHQKLIQWSLDWAGQKVRLQHVSIISCDVLNWCFAEAAFIYMYIFEAFMFWWKGQLRSHGDSLNWNLIVYIISCNHEQMIYHS